MAKLTHTLDLSYEIIGFDEVPPRDFQAPVLVDLRDEAQHDDDFWGVVDIIGFDEDCPASMAREVHGRLDLDAAFDTLDEAYDGGVESQAVFLARLVAVNMPECEGLRVLTMWRQAHTDPWIRAYDDNAEMHCR